MSGGRFYLISQDVFYGRFPGTFLPRDVFSRDVFLGRIHRGRFHRRTFLPQSLAKCDVTRSPTIDGMTHVDGENTISYFYSVKVSYYENMQFSAAVSAV